MHGKRMQLGWGNMLEFSKFYTKGTRIFSFVKWFKDYSSISSRIFSYHLEIFSYWFLTLSPMAVVFCVLFDVWDLMLFLGDVISMDRVSQTFHTESVQVDLRAYGFIVCDRWNSKWSQWQLIPCKLYWNLIRNIFSAGCYMRNMICLRSLQWKSCP